MAWITIMLVCLAIGTALFMSAARSSAARRRDKLETAFMRARGQRMVSNGIRSFR